jgi:hypothetical protein
MWEVFQTVSAVPKDPSPPQRKLHRVQSAQRDHLRISAALLVNTAQLARTLTIMIQRKFTRLVRAVFKEVINLIMAQRRVWRVKQEPTRFITAPCIVIHARLAHIARHKVRCVLRVLSVLCQSHTHRIALLVQLAHTMQWMKIRAMIARPDTINLPWDLPAVWLVTRAQHHSSVRQAALIVA